ncbi:MAG: family 16 glycoside hydrolase [Candidatus Sumerlaeaceae bacterium]
MKRLPEGHRFSVAIRIINLVILSVCLQDLMADDTVGDPLLNVRSWTWEQPRDPLIAAEDSAVQSLKDASRRDALIGGLIQIMTDNATSAAKAFAARSLIPIARDRDSKQLARLLASDYEWELARLVMSGVQGPVTEAVLIKALRDAPSTRTRVGTMITLAHRRSKVSVSSIAEYMSNANPEVADTAAWALGRIGGSEAAARLKSAAARQPGNRTVANSRMDCAAGFAAAGKMKESIAIYRSVLNHKSSAPWLRERALLGLLKCKPGDTAELVQSALRDTDPSLAQAAYRAIRELLDARAAGECLDMASTLAAERRARLLAAAAGRTDDVVLSAAVAFCEDPELDVAGAAIEALGMHGGSAHVSILATKASAAGSPLQEAARRALVTISAPGVDEAMVQSISVQSPNKAEIIRALTQRRVGEAVPALAAAARDADRPAAQAAIKALGVLANPTDLPRVVDLSIQLDEKLADAAAAEIAVIAKRHHQEAQAAALVEHKLTDITGSAERSRLVRVLARLKSPSALVALRSALSSTDVSVRREAIRGLSAWPDAAPLQDLRTFSRVAGDATDRSLALRGFIHMIEQLTTAPDSERLQFYREAMSQASQLEEKRMVLSGVGGLRSADALAFAEPYLTDNELRNEAAFAVVSILPWMVTGNADHAGELARRIRLSEMPPAIRQKAESIEDLLLRLEQSILSWQICGPFEKPGAECAEQFNVLFAPESEPAQASWQHARWEPDPAEPLYLDILKLFPGNRRVAYVRTWIQSPQTCEAVLKLGSDDGIKVWLNGKVVHANNVCRGFELDSDQTSVTLNQGWNALMLKVTQNTSGWGFSARLTDPQGATIPGIRVVNHAPEGETTYGGEDKTSSTLLFDGKSFEGWEGNLDMFRVQDGAIVAGTLEADIPQNAFLCTRRDFGDFELRFKVRLLGQGLNAGVQFRSARVPNHFEVSGYQADIGMMGETNIWGALYDESRRNRFLVTPDQEAISRVLKPQDWNDYTIRCEGQRVRLWVNGVLTADYTEQDPSIPARGIFGLQIHSGPASEAWYKDIRISML